PAPRAISQVKAIRPKSFRWTWCQAGQSLRMRESLLKLLWRRRWVACWKTSLSKRPDVPDASKHHHHSFAAVASPAVAVRRSSPRMTSSKDIARLLEIMAALRDKETGCPWDVEQDFESIAPYTIEEAYEV